VTKDKEVILGVTGSIAAYKSCDIIRRLQDKGCQVAVVMTREAEKFVTPLTLGSLSGQRVYTEMFDMKDNAWQMGHILLAQKADLFLIAPATANSIAKIAHGIADDLLTCIAITTRAPILMAPAMNDEMYKNRIVQENIGKLKRNGVQFINPIKGKLACGTFDVGHLAEVDDIVVAAMRLLKK
jgi:phosphopantothenoylcysteine decarboxylase/phosphopantothenate--cysteine ligase